MLGYEQIKFAKRNVRDSIGKKEKWSLFADEMIVYLENPRESTKKKKKRYK